MLRLKTTLCTLFLTLLAINGFAATPKLRENLGGKNLEIMKNATFITLLTIVPDGVKDQYLPVPEVHLSSDEIARLKRNLLDDHNYDFGRLKTCKFTPEISFKFLDTNNQVLHVFISPSCNQILFGMGRKSVLLNYDPAHERLEDYFLQLVAETRSRNKERWRG